MRLEERVNNSLLNRIRSSLAGKISAYSLATALTFGVGLSCGGGGSSGGDGNGQVLVDIDNDSYKSDVDCNDNNNKIYPGALEICDSIDNQCPGDVGYGQIDEGVQNTYYRDFDGDSYGNPSSTTSACSTPIGYVSNNTDCNDNNNKIYPGALEICDSIDNQCPGDVGYGQIDEGCISCDDIDGDSYYSVSGCGTAVDCNDGNDKVYPNASELCDLIDNQCPGNVGYGQVDENDVCGKIAYSSDGDVYIMGGDGSNKTRLTFSGGGPNLYPDGCIIEFVSSRDGNGEIYRMNVDGSGEMNISNNPASDYDPHSLYPLTDTIFSSRRDGNPEIYFAPRLTNPIRLTNNPASDYEPRWSPDASKIAFTSGRDGNLEIYTMNWDGSGQTNLTNNPAGDDYPAWSPDGSKIIFHSGRDGNWGDIYIMNADGSGQTRLANNDPTTVTSNLSFSPDGSRISFTLNWDIYTMNADGGNKLNLTNSSLLDDASPSWSPTCTDPLFYPSGLDVYKVNPGQIGLYWNDNSNNETEFRILRQPVGSPREQIGTVGANVTTFDDNIVSNGTTYKYHVRACNLNGCSLLSNEFRITVTW